MPNFGAASDILRVGILLKHGGIYFDTDIEPVAPLGNISANYNFLVNRILGCYSNDVLWSGIVKPPFFIKYRARMIDNYSKLTPEEWKLRRTVLEEKNASTQEVTGPGALVDTIAEWGVQPTPLAKMIRSRFSQIASGRTDPAIAGGNGGECAAPVHATGPDAVHNVQASSRQLFVARLSTAKSHRSRAPASNR